ncbi:MAG: ABC transporter ATP-binding protein [Polyangiaceae bacterium]|nr:ABC transporter ATP-binding protein [Polyangiaceae bacterium]
MAECVLELCGVTKDYGTHVVTHVLHGIDLTLRAGELVALIGPSGSGKSTLLNITGLLDKPTGGKVFIQGTDTSGLGEEQLTLFRGRSIGFIFQFHHLLPAFTALENVMLPAYSERGRPSAEMRDRALELLCHVGLEARAQYKSIDLSGGQQQRVAIARALMQKPPLILADEPTGNLDTQSADQVFELLRGVNRQQGTALLVVTHDPRLAERCDRIVTLVDGRIASDVPHRPAADAAPAG